MTTSINLTGGALMLISAITALSVGLSLARFCSVMTRAHHLLLAAAALGGLVGAFLAGWGR